MASLPLLAFQHHVGSLLVDPGELEYVSELGQGALGLVEKGRMQQGGKAIPVVVKSYKPAVVATPEDFRELLMEAGKLARLTNPHIPQFYGLGCYDHSTLAAVRSSLFSVEEFVGTRSLRRLLAEQMRSSSSLYDMAWALRWASQVAEALAFLHACRPQFIHGDVTADNVFLEDHRHLEAAAVKLGDLKPHRHIYDKYVSLGSVAGPAAAQALPVSSFAVSHPNGAAGATGSDQYSLCRYSLQPHGSAAASGTGTGGGGSSGSAPGPLSSRGSGQQQGAVAAAGGPRGGHSGMPALHTIRSDPVAIGASGSGGGPPGWVRRGGGGAVTAGGLGGQLATQSPSGSSYSDAVAADSSSSALDPRGSTPLERFLITGVDDGTERGKKGAGVRWGPGVVAGGGGGGKPMVGQLNTAAAIEGGLMRMSRSLPGPSMLGALLGDEEDEGAPGGGEDTEIQEGSSGAARRRAAARRSDATNGGGRGSGSGNGTAAPAVPIPGTGRPPRALSGAGSCGNLLGALGSGGALSGSSGSGGGGGGMSGGGGGTLSPPALSWDLSPSGAGVPSGSVQTSLLDLFADVRGQQTEGPMSIALSGGGAAPPAPLQPTTAAPAGPAARGGIASALVAPSAAAAAGARSGGGPTLLSPFAMTLHGPDNASGGGTALPPLPPGVAAAARGGGAGGSDLSESKTHGSCNAFAALTAIDAIAEDDREGSSHGRARRMGVTALGSGASATPLQTTGSASSGALYGSAGGSFHGGASQSTASTGCGDEAASGGGGARIRLSMTDKGVAGAVTSRDRGLLYSAPELLRGERLTEKADVFSFGVLLYELLSRSLLLAWRLGQPPQRNSPASGVVGPSAAAAAATVGTAHPPSAYGGYAPPPLATPISSGPAAAAAAAAAAALDRSVSRSGRWAAAAASAQQQRGASADAAQMLSYAARVAEGYRPPLPPFWPPAVADLVTRCCAQEPHERPRMTDVLRLLRAITDDQKALAKLNSYVNTDVGFMPAWLDPAACSDANGGAVEGSGQLSRQRSCGSARSSGSGGRRQRAAPGVGGGGGGPGVAVQPVSGGGPAKAAAVSSPLQPPQQGGCSCSIC